MVSKWKTVGSLLKFLKHPSSKKSEQNYPPVLYADPSDVEPILTKLGVKQMIREQEQRVTQLLHAETFAQSWSSASENDEQRIWRSARLEAHGVWHCDNCHQENPLLLLGGLYPFGYLTCGQCEHPWTPRSTSSNVLMWWPSSQDVVAISSIRDSTNLYGQMCSCGLTHRARSTELPSSEALKKGKGPQVGLMFPKITCACGEKASNMWLRFKIGDNADYRLGDPHASLRRSIEDRYNVSLGVSWRR
jgi:hypothetical protein